MLTQLNECSQYPKKYPSFGVRIAAVYLVEQTNELFKDHHKIHLILDSSANDLTKSMITLHLNKIRKSLRANNASWLRSKKSGRW